MTARREPLRIEVGRPARLDDAIRYRVGVLLLLVRMFEELLLHSLGGNTLGHEVVSLVPQDADNFRRKRFIQYFADLLCVRTIIRRYRALFDMRTRALAQRLLARQRHEERDDGDYQEDVEKDLGNPDRAGGDAAESEQRRDEGDDEKNDRIVKHDVLPM
jgi:hypothetical protein